MKRILKQLALGAALTVVSAGFVVAQELTESQVPNGVQSYVYNQYPGLEQVSWSITKNDLGKKFYQADFKFGQNLVTAVFTNEGRRVYENLTFSKNNSPEQILDHAEGNFDKFKLLAVRKHTNYVYGSHKKKEVNYELVVRIGKDESTVWFDEGMYRHDSFETSNLAIK